METSGFLSFSQKPEQNLSISPSRSSLRTGAECLRESGSQVKQQGRPHEHWREWQSIKMSQDYHSTTGSPAACRYQSCWEILDLGSRAGDGLRFLCWLPPGTFWSGKLGLGHLKMQEEERVATGAAAHPLFGEVRRYELPWAVDLRKGKWAQAS